MNDNFHICSNYKIAKLFVIAENYPGKTGIQITEGIAGRYNISDYKPEIASGIINELLNMDARV